MLNIFLDNNAYDRLIELEKEEFDIITKNCKLYACDTIYDELDAMKKRHPDKLNKINQIRNELNIKKTAFFGFCRYDDLTPNDTTGFATYEYSDKEGMTINYNTAVYEQNIKDFLDEFGRKKRKNKTNYNDAIISAIAKHKDCILITYDGIGKDNFPKTKNKELGLYQAVKENGGNVMTFEELITQLTNTAL